MPSPLAKLGPSCQTSKSNNIYIYIFKFNSSDINLPKGMAWNVLAGRLLYFIIVLAKNVDLLSFLRQRVCWQALLCGGFGCLLLESSASHKCPASYEYRTRADEVLQRCKGDMQFSGSKLMKRMTDGRPLASRFMKSQQVQGVTLYFIVPCGKFRSPYLGKATAVARAVSSAFVCPNNGMAASVWDY